MYVDETVGKHHQEKKMDKMNLLFGDEFVQETAGFIKALVTLGTDLASEVLATISGELDNVCTDTGREEAK